MASNENSNNNAFRWLPEPNSQFPAFNVDSGPVSEFLISMDAPQNTKSRAHWLPAQSEKLPDRRGHVRASLGRRERQRLKQDELILSSDSPEVNIMQIPTAYAVSKRLLDIGGALAGIMALSPLLVGVACFIKLDGGPIFFSQDRVGLGGKKFKMWKFRSMVANAEALKERLAAQNESGGPTFKMKNDPRITPVGKFIRKYSIDELPQLWNVLVGDMTIVGPRPALPKEVASYRQWQAQRLAVKPGLTCIWQTSGRSTIQFDDWMRMDMRYMKSQGFVADVKLITKTVSVVIKGDGAY